jgi:hypothetical protein
MTATAVAQPSGSGAGSGSGSATGSGSGSGSGSAADPGSGSGSGSAAPAPAPAPAPADPTPNPAARKACVDAMNADPKFADSIIKVAENKLQDKMNSEQVLKDLCTLRDHQQSQDDVAKNKRHVLMAYIAMWLVAVFFVLFLWKKHQALKLEIAQLRKDLDAATKDGK